MNNKKRKKYEIKILVLQEIEHKIRQNKKQYGQPGKISEKSNVRVDVNICYVL